MKPPKPAASKHKPASAADRRDPVKGTGFSPYIYSTKIGGH